MAADVECFSAIERAERIEKTLRETTHNGFPITTSDGRLVGLVLRSQLMVLLARRAFVERVAPPPPPPPGWGASSYLDASFSNSNSTSLDEDAASWGLLPDDVEIAPSEGEPPAEGEPTEQRAAAAAAAAAYYAAIDTDMRTFHHRHAFHDRHVSTSREAIDRLGLTNVERAMRCDLGAFMKIAPLSVTRRCASWRALGYFRACALRHLVVVDDRNVVVGMLTRKDLIGAPRGTGGAGTGGGGGRGRVGEILNAAVDVAAREALDLDASGGDEIFVGAGNL